MRVKLLYNKLQSLANMNTLRPHITTLISQKPAVLRPKLSQQFTQQVLQRFFSSNLFVFLMQYIGLTLATFNHLFSPLWLASGTACAFIFLRGISIIPGIWLGTWFAYYFAHSGCIQALSSATLLTLQAYVMLRLSYRFIGPTLIFYERALLIKFIILSITITAICSYLLLIISYPKLHTIIPFLQLWLGWWLANINGLIIFACAIVTWDAYFPELYLLKNRMYILFIAMTSLCLSLLVIQSSLGMTFSAIVIMSFTIVISIKFKWPGSAAALLVQGILLNMASILDWSILNNIWNIFYFQIFILVEIVLGQLLSTQKIYKGV